VPPEIVGELLWPSIEFPSTKHVERLMVHEEYAPRSLAFGVSERADVNALGPAVHSVGSRITCAVGKFLSLDGPDQLRMSWIGLSIQDVET
jgi:hypothetical protein